MVQIEGSPVLSMDGTLIFVGTNDYKLYAVRTDDGVVAWESESTGGRVSTTHGSPQGFNSYLSGFYGLFLNGLSCMFLGN